MISIDNELRGHTKRGSEKTCEFHQIKITCETAHALFNFFKSLFSPTGFSSSPKPCEIVNGFNLHQAIIEVSKTRQNPKP